MSEQIIRQSTTATASLCPLVLRLCTPSDQFLLFRVREYEFVPDLIRGGLDEDDVHTVLEKDRLVLADDHTVDVGTVRRQILEPHFPAAIVEDLHVDSTDCGMFDLDCAGALATKLDAVGRQGAVRVVGVQGNHACPTTGVVLVGGVRVGLGEVVLKSASDR